MSPRSIRARTTIVATVATLLTLTIGSLLLLWTLQRSLTDSRDQVARTHLAELVTLVETGRLPDRLPAGEDEMAQVVGADGRVLAESVNLGSSSAVTTLAPPPGAVSLVVVEHVPDDRDTETFRIWATVADGPGGPARVYVGTSPERVREAVAVAGRALLVGVPAVAAGLAALLSWLVGRALAPVEQLRARVATLTEGDLSRRVPAPGTGDEIDRLAGTMNAMLDRLETGSRRQREFVADASHELLSPLASLRTQLEVAAAGLDHADPDSAGAGQLAGLVADLGADTDRMERLVRELLLLARSEAPVGPGAFGLVDLDEIVLAEVRRLQLPAGVSLSTSDVSAAPVRGHDDDLSRLVSNLLENAADHARTSVTISLRETAGTAELVVSDDGPGVPPELAERIFGRFVTGSSARRHGEGNGLGLAIARAVASRHGGTLTLDDGPGGASFRLRLPSA